MVPAHAAALDAAADDGVVRLAADNDEIISPMVVVRLRVAADVDGTWAVTSTATDERCAASCRQRFLCVRRPAPRARHRCVRRYIARGVSVLAMSCLERSAARAAFWNFELLRN